MSDYYNHVLLWLKANRPDYVLVRFHYSGDPRGEYHWYLEPVDYTHDDITWLGCNTYFEEYVNKFSKKATLKFFVFTEPGKKEEI